MSKCSPHRFAFLALAVAASHPALADSHGGDPAKGRVLAEMWCASCHLVSPEQPAATTEAPPFQSIAQDSRGQFEWLEAFLADPHPPMPQLSLTRAEIRDLAGYIRSLAPE
jgi:mono/diheme cytochrome c family protein